ncbi:MAG: hypothetical protein ACUVTP_08920 [Candidatus Fervidibacter sp.]|uniref:hypothetical protein n=1 Tax=Candidatus Fervidibacter sp. TaxID=3100871 RepID=UPI00404A4323
MRLFFNIEQVEHKRLISLEGNEIDYDLLVLIPPHRGFPIIDASGIGDKGGWIPTDKETLLVKGQERIFAIGDTTDLPVSKSGAAAHFQAHSCPKLDSTCPREGTQCPPRWKRDVFCEGRREESEAYSFQLLKTSQTAPTVNLVIWYWWQKVLINRLYFTLVPKGISPTMFFATLQGKFA